MNYHKKANLTLAAVLLVFLGSAIVEHFYPNNFGVKLAFFVSEAALVGGIADWFAVTAIFKKPLGWGYHTALIPRNREKVIEAVASTVQKELLNIDLLRKKIEGIPFSDMLLRYVEKEGGTTFLTEQLVTAIQRYAEHQEPGHLAEQLAKLLRTKAKAWSLAPKVQIASQWALKHGYVDQGIDRLAESLWDKVSEGETRKLILRTLEEIKHEKVSNGGAIMRTLMGFVEMSDGLNLDEAADALQVEMLLTLRNFQDSKHPLRVTLKDTLLEKMADLEQDTLFGAQVERWKDDILSETSWEDFLTKVLQTVKDTATAPSTRTEPNALSRAVLPYVEKYWLTVQENSELRGRINSFIVDTLCLVIQNEHDLIGNTVRETLSAYTDQDLNRFVEEKAGNDLQWIRINGSMIGGVVGLILFLALEFVYTPYILPSLQMLISHIQP